MHSPVGYRPSICDSTLFEIYFKYVFTKSDITSKTIVSTGDFNVNLLDFNISKKVQVLLMFNFGMIPAINKGKRITM